MTIALPTRIIPGALVTGVFAAVGFGAGFVSPDLPHPQHWGVAQLAWPTVCLLAAFYIRQIWVKGHHPDPVRRVRALSPRLQAVIFAVCLVAGMFVGVLCSEAFGRFL